jgi:hypothetical protein
MLKKFTTQNRNPTFDGDVLIFKGKVKHKQVRNDEYCVDCEIWGEKSDGSTVVTGTATVALPSRVSITRQGEQA